MTKYTITFKPVDGQPPRVIIITAACGLSSGSSYLFYKDANRTQLIASYQTASIDFIETEPA